MDRNRLKARLEPGGTPDHYNELGVRKYDLAAGGIQGLRPLRYEKRVARNRFIALVILLFFVLLGAISVLLRHR